MDDLELVDVEYGWKVLDVCPEKELIAEERLQNVHTKPLLWKSYRLEILDLRNISETTEPLHKIYIGQCLSLLDFGVCVFHVKPLEVVNPISPEPLNIRQGVIQQVLVHSLILFLQIFLKMKDVILVGEIKLPEANTSLPHGHSTSSGTHP